MWTLVELIEIDESVRGRYHGVRVLTEEKVGLSLKEPEDESSQDSNVRKLTYEICGMHYTSPQYNVILLLDEINRLTGKESVKEASYSAPQGKIYFYYDKESREEFESTKPIEKAVFLSRFAVRERDGS